MLIATLLRSPQGKELMSLRPSEELRPANSHPSKLGSRLPKSSLEMTDTLADTLIAVL